MRIILISLLISGAAWAATSAPSSIDRYGLIAENFSDKMFSKKDSQALKEYFAMLGVGKGVANSHVWNENVGFNSRFENQFSQDSCFRDKLVKFYGNIAEFIRKKSAIAGPPSVKMASAENTCISGTSKYSPNTMLTYDCPAPGRSQVIANVAGKGIYANFEPGWVWKIAQEVTDGDAMASLSLIAACGHDDMTHGFSYEKINPTLKAKILNCPPRDSVFYAAQNLDATADISPGLKKKIIEVQSRTGTSLPAKYYHVYAAAYATCHLIKAGFDPGKVKFLQQAAAWAYRSINLCEKQSAIMGKMPQIEAMSAQAGIEGKRLEDFLLTKASLASKNCSEVNAGDKRTCEFLHEFDVKERRDLQATRSTILRILSEFDGANLYARWFLPGTVFGVKLPCSDVRLFGPRDLLNSSESVVTKFIRPPGWSQERYLNAKKAIAERENDFDWTVAQHKVGAEFSAKHCKKEDSSLNFCSLGNTKIDGGKILSKPVDAVR